MRQVVIATEETDLNPLVGGWMRITRQTLDDDEKQVKFELLVLTANWPNIEYEWREFPGKGTTFTDIAPMNQYLLRKRA